MDRGFMSDDGLSWQAGGRPAGPGAASFQTPNRRHVDIRVRAHAPVDGRGAWPAKPLTQREIEVLHLLPGPLSLREIAAELHISPDTVKSHTRAIYRKLGVSRRRDVISRKPVPQARPDPRASGRELLTEREIEVLHLLRGPLPLREIAAELHISPDTVKSHTRAIYRKLGVSRRRDAVARRQDAAA
jgi:ATP/maltotriose-dependent transcriptional regulator MalT